MPTLSCPICGRTLSYKLREDVPHRPFCSRRCKLIDLHRWLNEEYRVTEELPSPRADENGDAADGRDAGGGG